MAKKTTIYIDGSALVADHFSGIGHYTQGIVVTLDKMLDTMPDVHVYIIVPFKRIDKLQKYHFRNIRIKKIPLPMGIFREQFVVRGRLPWMDVFFGKGVYFSPDFITWPLLRSKAITTIHDLSSDVVPHLGDPNNARFLSKACRQSVERADYIATVTQTMRKEMAAFYKIPEERIIVTNNAADLQHFYKRSNEEITTVKHKYGIYGDYILSVGNIEPRKNQMALLRAYMKLPRELTDKYGLVFVGAGGWQNEEFKEVIDKALADDYRIYVVQGRVTDKDLPAIFSGATVFGYTSVYEGFGMPPLEAMACRTVVVSSDASVLPEVVGDGAIMVDPHKDATITKGLEKALRLPPEERAALLEKGYARAQSYHWETAVQTLVDYSRKLMQGDK